MLDEKKTEKSFDIIPDTSLWKKLGKTKYNISKSLGELIDNAIDNSIIIEDKNGPRKFVDVKIFFEIEGNYIGIMDTGCGMTFDKLKNALTIAYHKSDDGTIGEFGFGLKSATSFLGRKLTIYTKTEEMEKCIKFSYDEKEFIKNNKWTVSYEYVDENILLNEVGVKFNHGTYILIEDLNVKLYKRLTAESDKTGVIIPKFKRIYRKLLKSDELKLTLCIKNKKTNKYIEKEIEAFEFNNFVTKVDFEFKIKRDEKEMNIKGYAGVLPFFTKNDDVYQYSGFLVSKRGKVIIENGLIGYNFHPEKRLITGEIDLPNFETLNNKSDFLRNNDWHILEMLIGKLIVTPLSNISKSSYIKEFKQAYLEDEFDKNTNINLKLKQLIENAQFKNLNENSDFINEVKPYEIVECSIEIDESKFEDYINSLNKNDFNNDNNSSDLKKMDIMKLENQNNKEIIKIKDINNKKVNNNDFKINNKENYSFEFEIDKIKIKHEIRNLDKKEEFTYCFNEINNSLEIISNEKMFKKNLETKRKFCFNNIISAILEYKIINISKVMVINKEMMITIRGDIRKKVENVILKY